MAVSHAAQCISMTGADEVTTTTKINGKLGVTLELCFKVAGSHVEDSASLDWEPQRSELANVRMVHVSNLVYSQYGMSSSD